MDDFTEWTDEALKAALLVPQKDYGVVHMIQAELGARRFRAYIAERLALLESQKEGEQP